jgi:hypothetical protein
MKVFISLRLIPRLAKNFTSSTVFALRTIKAINAHPNTSPAKRIAQRKPNIIQSDFFLTCFLSFTLTSSFTFSQILSPFCHGAVLVKSL